MAKPSAPKVARLEVAKVAPVVAMSDFERKIAAIEGELEEVAQREAADLAEAGKRYRRPGHDPKTCRVYKCGACAMLKAG